MLSRCSRRFCVPFIETGFLANGNSYEVDSNTCFVSGKTLYPFEVLSFPKSNLLFETHSYLESVELSLSLFRLLNTPYWLWFKHLIVTTIVQFSTSNPCLSGTFKCKSHG
jgi:hypothetical protein